MVAGAPATDPWTTVYPSRKAQPDATPTRGLKLCWSSPILNFVYDFYSAVVERRVRSVTRRDSRLRSRPTLGFVLVQLSTTTRVETEAAYRTRYETVVPLGFCTANIRVRSRRGTPNRRGNTDRPVVVPVVSENLTSLRTIPAGCGRHGTVPGSRRRQAGEPRRRSGELPSRCRCDIRRSRPCVRFGRE